MTGKRLLLAVGVGALVGVVVAAVMTFLDWRLNPGGIFHDTQGTDWGIVLETAVSWFGPVFVVVTVLALLLATWQSR